MHSWCQSAPPAANLSKDARQMARVLIAEADPAGMHLTVLR
jgi:hypothetical protein